MEVFASEKREEILAGHEYFSEPNMGGFQITWSAMMPSIIVMISMPAIERTFPPEPRGIPQRIKRRTGARHLRLPTRPIGWDTTTGRD